MKACVKNPVWQKVGIRFPSVKEQRHFQVLILRNEDGEVRNVPVTELRSYGSPGFTTYQKYKIAIDGVFYAAG